MGFLKIGRPLTWSESTKHIDYVKTHGLQQLIFAWKRHAQRQDDSLRWGDEIEFTVVSIKNHICQLFLDAERLIEILKKKEHELQLEGGTSVYTTWNPEFGNHMIEATPSPPYTLNIDSILGVENNMRIRRMKIQGVLGPTEFVVTQGSFPRFGLKSFACLHDSFDESTFLQLDPGRSVSRSIFVPDIIMNPHPRFATLVANILERRQAKPVVVAPLYKDIDTPQRLSCRENTQHNNSNIMDTWDFCEPLEALDRFSIQELSHKTLNPIRDHVYMDAFAFGMGSCCLQATYMCKNVSESRYLYDQLLVLSPLFLSLSAATPVLRGFLVDTDTRWNILEQAVDCRTQEEKRFIPKSRFSASSLYISDTNPLLSNLSYWNDTDVPVNKKAEQFLLDHHMDPILAKHFAYLWIRDPMVIYKDRIFVNDEEEMDHFENIQSTNWNSVRFKPPPVLSTSDHAIGWRVECRTPDVQLTDFENAALIAIITVLVRIILEKRIHFYIPMRLNDENMRRANRRNAVLTQTFFYRIARNDTDGKSCEADDGNINELYLKDIFCQSSSDMSFPGLLEMCQSFVREQYRSNKCTEQAMHQFDIYANFLKCRVLGELLTGAQYLREFVTTHPCYQRNSVVNQTIGHDIVVLCFYIGFNLYKPQKLLGSFSTAPPYIMSNNNISDYLQFPKFSSALTELVRKREGYLADFPLSLLLSEKET